MSDALFVDLAIRQVIVCGLSHVSDVLVGLAICQMRCLWT